MSTARWLIEPLSVISPLSMVGACDSIPLQDVLASTAVLSHFQKVLDDLAASSTGSANRIARLCLLSQAPTIDKGEITDKGSINQRAVL
ncbi:MAG: feruloyl-CoA synthase, partial [Brachymonas sp.]